MKQTIANLIALELAVKKNVPVFIYLCLKSLSVCCQISVFLLKRVQQSTVEPKNKIQLHLQLGLGYWAPKPPDQDISEL